MDKAGSNTEDAQLKYKVLSVVSNNYNHVFHEKEVAQNFSITLYLNSLKPHRVQADQKSSTKRPLCVIPSSLASALQLPIQKGNPILVLNKKTQTEQTVSSATWRKTMKLMNCPGLCKKSLPRNQQSVRKPRRHSVRRYPGSHRHWL